MFELVNVVCHQSGTILFWFFVYTELFQSVKWSGIIPIEFEAFWLIEMIYGYCVQWNISSGFFLNLYADSELLTLICWFGHGSNRWIFPFAGLQLNRFHAAVDTCLTSERRLDGRRRHYSHVSLQCTVTKWDTRTWIPFIACKRYHSCLYGYCIVIAIDW